MDRQKNMYLICYDIADPKRLYRVHRILIKQGVPVQYSVFTVLMTRPALLTLLEQLQAVIDEYEDDVRCYRLPSQIEVWKLGQQFFPEDVMLFTNGQNVLW